MVSSCLEKLVGTPDLRHGLIYNEIIFPYVWAKWLKHHHSLNARILKPRK